MTTSPGWAHSVHEAGPSVLSAIFPALRDGRRSDAAAPVERYELFCAVRGLLERLASPGLVLLLDDLHWADEKTVVLLSQLLRQLPRRPVLLILAYRCRPAPERLRGAMASVRSEHGPTFLRLGPLREEEAVVLLAGRGSARGPHVDGRSDLAGRSS